jgi:Xaa-Pro aminopeptidase
MSPRFAPETYRKRMERSAAAAAEAGLTGLLIAPGPDLLYLTGYRPAAITERLTLLVLAAGREPAMIVPAVERPGAADAPVLLSDWADGDDPYAACAKLLGRDGRYAISDSAWAMHLLGLQEALPATGYTSLTRSMPMLRAVKDADELRLLAGAAAAADAAYDEILRARFAGRREADVAAELALLLRKHGHSQVDFTVVGSGPNGASPHHEAGDRVIGDGDMVVLDFGGRKDGYGSDTTRTVHVGDHPGDEMRKVHDVVREAQQKAFEAVRPGIECQEIDRAARRHITEAGYGEFFTHRVGRGIGLTTHEPPYLVEGETGPLVPGMCFSIEPGVYLPGRFGVRIEDIVTVTSDGGRRLNTTPQELRTVT